MTHLPKVRQKVIQAYDSSRLSSPDRLPRGDRSNVIRSLTTVDLDAIDRGKPELIAAAAVAMARIAQFFGNADARYIRDDGAIKKRWFDHSDLRQHVEPVAEAHGLRLVDSW